MKANQYYAGACVVITGAGSGIGRLMALRIVEEGGRVAIWDINGEAARTTADMANAQVGADPSDPKAIAFTVDVTDNAAVQQAAEHMNAKVSPFLAFLTQMHEHVSAMEPPVVNNIQGWDRIPEGQPIYLDADGNPMVESEMDAATRQLLDDYKLIQYDVTAGDGYLKDLGDRKSVV